MTIVVLVGDGMGDYPLEQFGGKTPLQAARIPNMRRAAAAGDVCLVCTTPDGMAPGSDVANLSLLGFDPSHNYGGRAPLEAAGAGLDLAPRDVAYRCNLVTVRDGVMEDYSAGHISTEEAAELVRALNDECREDGRQFHRGVSYRHLLVWQDGPLDLRTVPPHDILSQPVAPHLPEGARGAELCALMEESRAVFERHPVVQRRIAAGEVPATQIWLWGQGKRIELPSYSDLYGLTGRVISAVDLVRGLGRLAGLEPITVPGATGFLDTNYAGKVDAAIEGFSAGNYIFVHIEAPDECGHIGDPVLKVEAIEQFDERVVGPVWRALEERGAPYTLVVCTDHRTPVSLRTHTADPVPLTVVRGPVGTVTDEAPFDEFVASDVSPAFAVLQRILKSG